MVIFLEFQILEVILLPEHAHMRSGSISNASFVIDEHVGYILYSTWLSFDPGMSQVLLLETFPEEIKT